jgi:hypothetical protein
VEPDFPAARERGCDARIGIEFEEEQTASLYAALLDAMSGASGPRYKSRTVSSFAWSTIARGGRSSRCAECIANLLARFSPYSV